MASSTADADQDDLLEALQAHGQQFLSSFGSYNTSTSTKPNSRKRRKLQNGHHHETVNSGNEDDGADEDEDYAEPWFGIQESGDSDTGSEEDDEEDDGSEAGDDYRFDDEFTSAKEASGKAPEVVVFDHSKPKTTDGHVANSKAAMKAFMSSKVSRLKEDDDAGASGGKEDGDEDYEDERTLHENDALLHKLVHTKLLSGSLNPDLNVKPADRRRALAGRVMEAAGYAKLGKGESQVNQAERSKASKNVRVGMTRKQQEREQKSLEEAKNLGNYHPTLKKLFEPSSAAPTNRKRERGLKLGVGSFKGGILTLRKSDIAAAQGSSSRGSHNSGRGKGKRRK